MRERRRKEELQSKYDEKRCDELANKLIMLEYKKLAAKVELPARLKADMDSGIWKTEERTTHLHPPATF
eukprot:g1113.t1